MQDLISFITEQANRASENLIGRISGPMKLRLVLQPLMSVYFAVRAGLNDAKTGRPPYLLSLVTTREPRREMLREGWKDVGKVFVMAVLIDAVYQIVVAHWVYPGEALLMAVLLAFVPYLLVRGAVLRLARRNSPK